MIRYSKLAVLILLPALCLGFVSGALASDEPPAALSEDLTETVDGPEPESAAAEPTAPEPDAPEESPDTRDAGPAEESGLEEETALPEDGPALDGALPDSGAGSYSPDGEATFT